MLEGYLNQVPKQIPNLQQEANQLSKDVLSNADGGTNDRSGDVTPTGANGGQTLLPVRQP